MQRQGRLQGKAMQRQGRLQGKTVQCNAKHLKRQDTEPGKTFSEFRQLQGLFHTCEYYEFLLETVITMPRQMFSGVSAFYSS